MRSIAWKMVFGQILMLGNQGSNWLVGGIDPGRLGNSHPTVAPYPTFCVATGTVTIAIGNDSQFRAFCIEMGRPELGTDPRFATGRLRLANREAIEPIVQTLVANEDGPGADRAA